MRKIYAASGNLLPETPRQNAMRMSTKFDIRSELFISGLVYKPIA